MNRWIPAFAGMTCAVLMLLAGCAVQTAALQANAPHDLSRKAELVATPFFAQTDHLCGPAALATALGAAGITASPAALSEAVFLPAREGSLQAEMLAGARRHGAVATRIPGTLEGLLREVAAGHVVVLLQNLGLSFAPRWHYAVVVGYDLDASEVLLRSGTTQRAAMRLRTLEQAAVGRVVLINDSAASRWNVKVGAEVLAQQVRQQVQPSVAEAVVYRSGFSEKRAAGFVESDFQLTDRLAGSTFHTNTS